MFATKGKTCIGIDLSADRINLVRLEKRGKDIVLLDVRSRILPRDVKDKEEREAAFREALARSLEGIDYRKSILVAGLGGQIAFVRRLRLPPVPQAKVRQIVGYEVQQQIPFPLKEVVWGYQLASPIEKETKSLEVMMAAVKQEMVEGIVDQIKASIRLEPDIVDVSVLSLHNCLVFNNLLPEAGINIVLSVEWNFTDIMIENGQALAFTRSIPIGERNMLREIMRETGADYQEAENLLFSGKGEEWVRGIWEDLATEIKRTMNYYLSQVEKVTTFERIFLSGRLSTLKSFHKFLYDSFKSEVIEVNPWVNLKVEPSQIGEDSLYSVSIGLALRGLVSLPVEINLLPPVITGKKSLQRKMPYFVLSSILIPIVGVTFSTFAYQDYTITRLKLQRVEAIMEEFKPYLPEIEKLKKERGNLENRLTEVKKILAKRTFWSDLLREISHLTPSDIYILSLGKTTQSTGEGEITMERRAIPEREKAPVVRKRALPGEERRNLSPVPSSRGRRAETTFPPSPIRRGRGRKVSGETLYLRGRAKSFPRVDEYITRLKASPLFIDVVLENVQRGEGGEVEFTLRVYVKTS